MDDITPFVAIVTLFIGLPWLIFHYITKWKTSATLTGSDEKLLDELHDHFARVAVAAAYVAAVARPDRRVRVASLNYPGDYEFDLDDPGHVRVPLARGHAVDHPDHALVRLLAA